MALGLFGLFVKPDPGLWVVGVREAANLINHTARVFDKHYTVNLATNRFYCANHYDFYLEIGPLTQIARLFVGPVLLAYLIHRASGFFYIGNTGFLIHNQDGREFEYRILKSRGKKIVSFFCGTDIRSPALSIEHARENNIDVMMTYLQLLHPKFSSQMYEDQIKQTALVADKYSDHIYNSPIDQISYIKREVHPCLFFYPDAEFIRNDAKFENMGRVRIVHAPSSPFIKGTQILRSAIKKLQVSGYDFDYIEIIEQDNTIVLEQLKNAHIVVNELYAFVPGLLGVEAMAAHCALVTSADKNMEPALADGANDAWFVTRYWEIFDHLKILLDDKSLIKSYADKGFDWAYNNHRFTPSRTSVRSTLGLE